MEVEKVKEAEEEKEKGDEDEEDEQLRETTSVYHWKDNGIMIIRVGRSDWPTFLATVQGLSYELVVHILFADIMLLWPKTRPDVFISRERDCPRVSIYSLASLPNRLFCNMRGHDIAIVKRFSKTWCFPRFDPFHFFFLFFRHWQPLLIYCAREL